LPGRRRPGINFMLYCNYLVNCVHSGQSSYATIQWSKQRNCLQVGEAAIKSFHVQVSIVCALLGRAGALILVAARTWCRLINWRYAATF